MAFGDILQCPEGSYYDRVKMACVKKTVEDTVVIDVNGNVTVTDASNGTVYSYTPDYSNPKNGLYTGGGAVLTDSQIKIIDDSIKQINNPIESKSNYSIFILLILGYLIFKNK